MDPNLSQVHRVIRKRKRKRKQLKARWVAQLIKAAMHSHEDACFLLLTVSRNLAPAAAHNDNSAKCVVVVMKGDGVMLACVGTPRECHTVCKVLTFCQKNSPNYGTGKSSQSLFFTLFDSVYRSMSPAHH